MLQAKLLCCGCQLQRYIVHNIGSRTQANIFTCSLKWSSLLINLKSQLMEAIFKWDLVGNLLILCELQHFTNVNKLRFIVKTV